MEATRQQLEDAALAIIRRAYAEQPELHTLAINADCTAIGSWSKTLGRFVMVAGYTITGQWVSMEYELLINGKHLPQTWTPHTRDGSVFIPTYSGKPLSEAGADRVEEHCKG